ncbi:hypothetical protein HT105_23660, partial [Bacteroides fragilis]|nr:hypothetical protein [Bacteroides fragilis]
SLSAKHVKGMLTGPVTILAWSFTRDDVHQSVSVVTENGWVQSYGSRCTRPPIVVGDISRPQPMTVEWAKYAQSLSAKHVKGMLTGPVTILAWSFTRDDVHQSVS